MEAVMTRSELKEVIKECYLEIKADNISINEGISISKGFKYVIGKIIEGIETLKRKAKKLLENLKKKHQERKEERYNKKVAKYSNIFSKLEKFIDDITEFSKYCEEVDRKFDEDRRKSREEFEEARRKSEELFQKRSEEMNNWWKKETEKMNQKYMQFENDFKNLDNIAARASTVVNS